MEPKIRKQRLLDNLKNDGDSVSGVDFHLQLLFVHLHLQLEWRSINQPCVSSSLQIRSLLADILSWTQCIPCSFGLRTNFDCDGLARDFELEPFST